MSSSGPNQGGRVVLVLAFLAVATLAIVVTYERARYRASMARLARERDELQGQLESRELTISQLKAEVLNLRSLVEAPSMSRSRSREAAPPQTDAALRRQLAELQSTHSNTLALAGSLLAEKSRTEEAEQARKANEAVVAELESATSEAVQNAESARQKTEELLNTLNVPPNLEAMDTGTALASPNLRAYWPYFEAKREQELLGRVVDALRLRLLQESAGTNAEPAPNGNPP